MTRTLHKWRYKNTVIDAIENGLIKNQILSLLYAIY